MNKTVVFVAFALLAAFGVIGVILITIFRPDAVGSLTTNITTILGLVVVAAGTFYGLGKQNDKLDVIKTQTNGTLSKLTDENTRLTDLLIRRGLDPVTGENTMPRSQIAGLIQEDSTGKHTAS